MRYRHLGRTGLKVSELSIGTTTFVAQVQEGEAIRIIHRALDAGVNLVDTANVYGKIGGAETFVGKALKGRRHSAVLATKVFNTMGPLPNDRGLSRKHIMTAVDDSLRRLQTDHIDLYQMHQWDAETPLEETLRAMDDLVRGGKVRYIGCSNFLGWQLCKSLWISDVRNLHRIECIQSRYNLVSRDVEQEVAPLCLAEQIGMIVYNPLAGGFLTGKYKRGEAPPPDTRLGVRPLYSKLFMTEHNFDTIDRLRELSNQSGKSLIHLVLGWLLAQPVVSSVILGATSAKQLDESIGMGDITLTPDEVKACDAAAGLAKAAAGE